MDHTITPDQLFNQWCDNQESPELLSILLGITPAQLADLADNPEFLRRVAVWERLTRAYKETLVFDHQRAAAATLRQTMAAPDPIEARRAATTLAHLSRNMLPARTALQRSASRSGFAQAGTAPGGTALQSGVSDDPTPPQSAAPSAPSTPPSTQPASPPEPPTAPLPFDAPLPLPLVASSSQVITKLIARAGAAARTSGP